MILTALEKDYDGVVQSRELGNLMRGLVASLQQAALLDPWYVANGSQDGLINNHLAIQGFYLLRARTQMREITNILLK